MNPGPLIILHCIHPIFNRNEAFVFLHGYALLLTLTKSSKSKNQVVHEQKFKDPLNSRGVEESIRLGIRGPGLNPHGGNILSLEYIIFV